MPRRGTSKSGTKVVVELTTYPGETSDKPKGVITEVLGAAGEKDVDLKAVIIQFNLPGPFSDEVKNQARAAIDNFRSGNRTTESAGSK